MWLRDRYQWKDFLASSGLATYNHSSPHRRGAEVRKTKTCWKQRYGGFFFFFGIWERSCKAKHLGGCQQTRWQKNWKQPRKPLQRNKNIPSDILSICHWDRDSIIKRIHHNSAKVERNRMRESRVRLNWFWIYPVQDCEGWGWIAASVRKVLAMQMWRPDFKSLSLT